MNSSIKNNFLVSIVIPCYNVQDYIKKCIYSVLNQTYQPIEIICVDNNSTDDTYSILMQLKSLADIKVCSCFKRGANHARNLGLKKSSGDWIQFLDADDILLPNKIEFQVAEILNGDNSDVVFSPFTKRSTDGFDTFVACNEIIELGLLATKLGITSSNLFKASKVKSCGMWNVNQESSQEYELMFRMYKSKAIFKYCSKNSTVNISRKSGQISTSNMSDNWNRYVDLRVDMINYFHHEILLEQNIKIMMDEIFFDCLRILAKYDLPKANKLYFNYLSDYKPIKSKSNSFLYVTLFHFLGFKKTELIKSFFYD